MDELVLTNALLVMPDEVMAGTLAASGGVIRDVSRGASCAPGAVDCGGDFLLPGLVDLHTDSLERQLTPRPGVLWPQALGAALANDAFLAAQGITTVFDSLCAEAFPIEEAKRQVFHSCLRAVLSGVAEEAFRAEHYLHLRCETADPEVLEMIAPYSQLERVKLMSLMDHTPGQRQYRDMAVYRRHCGNGSDGEFSAMVQERLENQRRHAGPHRSRIIALAREGRTPLASHDDATCEHVEQAHAEGAAICEFPTTLEAARRARELGMPTVMGAPNIVMGGSHSGNVSAMDALRAGCLDILSSDYYPPSLLAAPFFLALRGEMELHEAVRLVSFAPAQAVGLYDRGSLTPGLRADMVRVHMVRGVAMARTVWCAGKCK
jgi:alpha-D-ribose 1-methylphosphonate 5-triphosphate diphosphatase